MSEEDLTNYKTYISDLDITKYIVLDKDENYWYSAEYVDKMLKKQDKEIERLNNKVEELDTKWINSLQQEEEYEEGWRELKEIIDEAREYIKWHYDLATEENVEFCLLRDRLLKILEKGE